MKRGWLAVWVSSDSAPNGSLLLRKVKGEGEDIRRCAATLRVCVCVCVLAVMSVGAVPSLVSAYMRLCVRVCGYRYAQKDVVR